jgi:hypothetical protein
VAVLLEEVVLDEPEAVDADPVGELALLERLLEDPPLVAWQGSLAAGVRQGRPACAYRWVTP